MFHLVPCIKSNATKRLWCYHRCVVIESRVPFFGGVVQHATLRLIQPGFIRDMHCVLEFCQRIRLGCLSVYAHTHHRALAHIPHSLSDVAVWLLTSNFRHRQLGRWLAWARFTHSSPLHSMASIVSRPRQGKMVFCFDQSLRQGCSIHWWCKACSARAIQFLNPSPITGLVYGPFTISGFPLPPLGPFFPKTSKSQRPGGFAARQLSLSAPSFLIWS